MQRYDFNRKPFEFPTCYLEPKEYARIISEINTNYKLYEKESFALHFSASEEEPGAYYFYYFENHGYGDYNIVEKILF